MVLRLSALVLVSASIVLAAGALAVGIYYYEIHRDNVAGDRFYTAIAELNQKNYPQAAADFEKIIGNRGWPEWEVYAPMAQLGLARAYAMQRDSEESRKAYDEFFTTWKDADPDIAILRQGKAEYKKLRATAFAAALASGKKQ